MTQASPRLAGCAAPVTRQRSPESPVRVHPGGPCPSPSRKAQYGILRRCSLGGGSRPVVFAILCHFVHTRLHTILYGTWSTQYCTQRRNSLGEGSRPAAPLQGRPAPISSLARTRAVTAHSQIAWETGGTLPLPGPAAPHRPPDSSVPGPFRRHPRVPGRSHPTMAGGGCDAAATRGPRTRPAIWPASCPRPARVPARVLARVRPAFRPASGPRSGPRPAGPRLSRVPAVASALSSTTSPPPSPPT
jgi:hypothetical protein